MPEVTHEARIIPHPERGGLSGVQATGRRPPHDDQRPGNDVSHLLRGLQAPRSRLMDHSRYLAYRSVGRSLDRTPEWLVDDSIRDRLQDIAEALLLTSDAEDAEHRRRD